MTVKILAVNKSNGQREVITLQIEHDDLEGLNAKIRQTFAEQYPGYELKNYLVYL